MNRYRYFTIEERACPQKYCAEGKSSCEICRRVGLKRKLDIPNASTKLYRGISTYFSRTRRKKSDVD